MTSWLHEQRLVEVQQAVRECGARTVLDLGCGDGDFLIRLVTEPQVERVVGIDLSLDALSRLRARLGALNGAASARVDLVHGSMTDPRPELAGFDCAILLETIEHLDPGRLSVLERAVFAVMRPATVIITTPNADFNPLLGMPPDRFRHPEHRFEWGRQRFRSWAQGVAERNGYRVECSDLAGRHPIHGGASQMAVLTRAQKAQECRA